MKNILLLRTNQFSKRWYNILKGILDPDIYPFIALDNKNGKISYGGIPTILFNTHNINDLGLKIAKDMQWRFGDYALYLLNSVVTEYDYIWLVEPDVYVRNTSIDSLIKSFNSESSDFICSYFDVADKNWMWSKYLHELQEDKAYKTFFPLIRISKKAVEYLYAERIKLETLANDEVFVATKLNAAGFKISRFSDFTHYSYSKNSFSYRLPHYYPLLKLYGKDDFYHPVHDRASDYINHLVYKKSWKAVIKMMLNINNKD